jgi:hypothetical protein
MGTRCPRDLNGLLVFYDSRRSIGGRLRATNPIEPTFATVRHRTKLAKWPGSTAAGLAVAFKLIEAAQTRWRAVNARNSSPRSAPAPFELGPSSNTQFRTHCRYRPRLTR